MQQPATSELMRPPDRRWNIASLKYRIFGHPRFLLRGRKGAHTEISLATMVYNLKRTLRVLGGNRLRLALAS